MNNDPRPWCRKRWLIIYNALVDPREASEIAKHTGVSVSTVHKVVSPNNKFGLKRTAQFRRVQRYVTGRIYLALEVTTALTGSEKK
jgi:transposase